MSNKSKVISDAAFRSSAEVCCLLNVNPKTGLTSDEDIALRLAEYGKNELPTTPATPFWELVLAQFEDLLVRILLAAAAISFVMALIEGNRADFVEPFIILLILTLNAIVGVWQENRAEGAIEALKEFMPATATVIRDGVSRTIHAAELARGDIVLITVGNRVPADIRLLELESTTLRVDQSILNGESEEVMKQIEAVTDTSGRFHANMVYSGTAVVYGRAKGVVVCTGTETEIGSIERNVRDQEDVKTPLQVKLDEFGVLLSRVIGYICIAVFVVNLVHWFSTHDRNYIISETDSISMNTDQTQTQTQTHALWYDQYIQPVVHSLKVAVALAVAAIPEGLPAVVTTCLALGTRRMARDNALVRDLPSVETLGRCTVICSDKTGTLTTNMMSVREVVTLDSPHNNRNYDNDEEETCKKMYQLQKYTLHDSHYDIIAGAVSIRSEDVNSDNKDVDDNSNITTNTSDNTTHNDSIVSEDSTVSSQRSHSHSSRASSQVSRAIIRNRNIIHEAISHNVALETLANVAVLCNEAALHYNPKTHHVEKIGEATEAALLVMAEKLSRSAHDHSHTVNKYRALQEKKWNKEATLEFTRTRKSMSVYCTQITNNAAKKSHNGCDCADETNNSGSMESHQDVRMSNRVLLVKGAPEELLRRSTMVMCSDGSVVKLTPELTHVFENEMSQMTNHINALRCIAFAIKESMPDLSAADLREPNEFERIESDLTFVGLCGMLDPPREEVALAIARCRSAGIRVIVITGDKKETAEAVCAKIGLLDYPIDDGLSYTGEQFDTMDIDAQRNAVMTAVVFSRTDPSHKMKLVKLLQEQKLICAMTGDGVNDSPALKKADIGIAMGSGTEVAKNASKMILADDNFATVVKAVKEGRCIFNNTKQFIRYLISSNIGEVTCVLVTGLCGLPEALSPIQLLWVNLVTDGLPATALGFNAADPDIMNEPPRSVEEPIVNGWLFIRYMVIGLYVGMATVSGFVWWFITHGFTWTDMVSFTRCVDMTDSKCVILANPSEARSISLSILVVVEMLNALNALSENQSLLITRPSTNVWLLLAIASSILLHLLMMYIPFLANMFAITPLGVPAKVLQEANPWSIVWPIEYTEWKAILVFSIPVIFIDELLKLITRRSIERTKVRK